MTGGSFKNSANLLGRRREIEELEKETQSLSKALEEKRLNSVAAEKADAEDVSAPAEEETKETERPIHERLDLEDEDATIACLVAAIDCRNQYHKNVEIVGVRRIA